MAVAFDAVGPSSSGGGTVGSATATSASWSHTCTGSNLVLVVGLAIGITGTGSSSVTYNGVSMTSLGAVNSNNATAGYCQLFGLVNPASGANTVAITTSPAGSITGGSLSFTGASGVGTAVTAFGSSTAPSVAVTGTTSGNVVADVVSNGSTIASSNQTLRWLLDNNNDTAAGHGAGSTAAAGGSVTMSYSVTSDWWGMVAVEVLAAAPIPPSTSLVVSQIAVQRSNFY